MSTSNYIAVADGRSTLYSASLDAQEATLTNAEIDAIRKEHSEKVMTSYYKDVDKSRAYQRDKYHKRMDAMTPEEKKAFYAKKNRENKARLERMKRDDPARYEAMKEDIRVKRRARHERDIKNKSQEQRDRENANARRYYCIKMATMSDEDKQEMYRKQNATKKARLAKLSPEEYEAYLEHRREIGRKSYHRRKSIHKYKKQYYQ